MIFPSVDNFLKIFSFYQLNSIKSVKELSKTSYRYNTIDKFFDALNLTYDDDQVGLTYPKNKTEILQSISSRLDVSEYFNNAGFPGSYSFNTNDAYMFKSIILDWAGTIKTFQDSTSQCTNAYLLSSEDVDKAIRGFGIDFINSRSVSSLNRRQTFLLNMCDLYKIKGTPQSIIRALNIVGLEDIYITEAWVYPTRDGKKNIEIKWIPVKQPQEFDQENNCYVDKNEGLEVDYWDWGKFNSKIGEIKECHWFYKKQEIINLNWDDADTYFHLPSLTPYFNIKFKFKSNDHATVLRRLEDILKDQLGEYLKGNIPIENISLEDAGVNYNFLSIWNGFLYALVMYADFLRYNELNKFLKRFGFTSLDTSDIKDQFKYQQLIYKVYTFINSLTNEKTRKIYTNALSYFTITSVPIGYCSYEELKYWWLTTKHTDDDTKNGLDVVKQYINPTYVDLIANNTHVEIFWNEDYNYGYYDLQICKDIDGLNNWITIAENCPVRCEAMQRIIDLNLGDEETIPTQDIEKRFRIVHNHTINNIPSIFFEKPFYYGSGKQDSDLDMIYYFNREIIKSVDYINNPFYKLFENKSSITIDKVSDDDLINNYLDYVINFGPRSTDKDYKYRTFLNSFLQYPNSLFVDDLNILRETVVKKYINELTFNYKDYISHDAEKLNYINVSDKYPQNKKWNWGVSYGDTTNTSYYFINYEGTKWCRIKSNKLFSDCNVRINDELFDSDYGVPLYLNGEVYIHVAKGNAATGLGNYFHINDKNCVFEDNWNALGYEKKIYPYSEQLQNDLENEYGITPKKEGDNLVIEVPPSDIFPSIALNTHKYFTKEADGINYTERNFYFSDTLFKPDSKLAKCVVMDKIDLSYCDYIYQQVADVQNIYKKDYDLDNNRELNYSSIPVYHDPFGENTVKNYSYEEFLKYLYSNSYILDINNGFVYKQFSYYLDDNTNYLYMKCIDLNSNSNAEDKIIYKWIRVKVSREWSNDENRLSIFYKLLNDRRYDYDRDGSRIPYDYCTECEKELTYKNVYDSARYLKDPVVREDEDYNLIDKDINRILVLKNGKYHCEIRQDFLNSDGKIISKFVKEDDVKQFTKKSKVQLKCTKYKDAVLNSTNFGINNNLYNYINDKFDLYNESVESYENVIIRLCNVLQDYLKNFGITSKLDVYAAHIFNSRLIKNIVFFYKPKRDRILQIASQVEIDKVDVNAVKIGDMNYNSVYLNNCYDYNDPKYDKRENGLPNRSRIRHEINEYVPFNDLIFLKDNINNNEVVNYREVYPYANNQIPQIETYDKIENIQSYYIQDSKGKRYANFYCSLFKDGLDGFYFVDTNDDSKYYNDGNYIFVRGSYVFQSDYDIHGNLKPEPSYVTLSRWFIFQKQYIDKQCYKAEYVSEENISENPYCNKSGKPIKYCKLNNIKNYNDLLIYINNCDYTYGDFQIKTLENLGYIKVGLRRCEPIFYIGGFDNNKYNGYYYKSDTFTRFGMPCYHNCNGKMISFYDLSYLTNTYLNTYIKPLNDQDIKKFWIITDYCQIPDISEATYIAYSENGDNSIFKIKNGINSGETLTFYKLNPKIDSTLSDLIFVCGVRGYSMDVINENPHLLGKDYQTYRSKYNNENYTDLINRRIFQGTLPVKYEPISYINFYYNHALVDFYKNENGDSITTVELEDVDKKDIVLSKKYYGHDYWGYEYGSLFCGKFTRATFKNDISYSHTVIFRVRNLNVKQEDIYQDKNWHLYAVKYNSENNKTYIYVNKEWKESSININNITFERCYICEYAVFDKDLPEWYFDIIEDFGVFAYRKEQCKKFTTGSKDKYCPMFNTEEPRSCYGKFVTGLPENIEGDRFSSVLFKDDEYLQSHYDGNNRYNTYKYDALSYYYCKDHNPQEVSMLWSKKAAMRVYDIIVIPEYDLEGKLRKVNLSRQYVNNRLKINNLEKFFLDKKRMFFCDGQEFCVPSNYMSPYDNSVPVWWNKERSEYVTGPVQHRPLMIAVREKIDDYYPNVVNGNKHGKYFDDGLKFDGRYHVDCCGVNVFHTNEVDLNTSYTSTIDRFTNEEDLIDKQFCKKYYVENKGDFYWYECGNTESNIFYDPTINQLTQDMINSHVYHSYLRLDKSDEFKIDISGDYYPTKISDKLRKNNDFQYGYINVKSENEFNIAILTYDNMCRYYIWEIRHYEKKDEEYVETIAYTNYVKCRYILNPPEDRFVIKEDMPKNYTEIVEIDKLCSYYHPAITVDDNDMYFKTNSDFEYYSQKDINNVSELFFIARKIYDRYFKDTNKMYLAHNNYDYINQLQLDLCCQKLCEYRDTLREELRINPYVDVEQKPLDSLGFRAHAVIAFKRCSSGYGINYNPYMSGNYYIDNGKLYIRYRKYWYGPFEWNKEDEIPEQLKDICCHFNIVYVGEKLYVLSNYGWISVKFTLGKSNITNKIYEKYIDQNNVIMINVPYTNSTLDDWNYYVEEQKIETTIQRYKKLNNRGTEQFDHFGEEWPEDKKDDVYIGKGHRETVLDKAYVYAYCICEKDKHDIELHKPESEFF